MVRLFESGDDAAVAVLTTALYQAQPPAANDALADQPGEGRKLLTFSDSRQAAAFRPLPGDELLQHPAPQAHP